MNAPITNPIKQPNGPAMENALPEDNNNPTPNVPPNAI